MAEKEITLQESGYAALRNQSTISEAMAECDGLEFTLDRVKMPGGGATAFELPGDGEEPEPARELRGIIVHSHPAFSYYMTKYAGGNNPPDCGSFDGKVGIGTPGGRCAECYYNRFGSGEGNSKACRNRRMLYILQEGELFPLMLSLPTGSLREFTQYAKRLLSKGRKLSEVITKITLKKATSSAGITFSRAVFSMERVLTAEEKDAVRAVINDTREYARNLGMNALTVNEEAEEAPDYAEPLS